MLWVIMAMDCIKEIKEDLGSNIDISVFPDDVNVASGNTNYVNKANVILKSWSMKNHLCLEDEKLVRMKFANRCRNSDGMSTKIAGLVLDSELRLDQAV